jgi:hypothetical protein
LSLELGRWCGTGTLGRRILIPTVAASAALVSTTVAFSSTVVRHSVGVKVLERFVNDRFDVESVRWRETMRRRRSVRLGRRPDCDGDFGMQGT